MLLAFRWPVADDHEISCAWFAARANLAAVQAEPDRQPRSRSSKRSAKCPGTVIAVRIAGASRIGPGGAVFSNGRIHQDLIATLAF